ncbi:MAG: hypothetical protein ACPGGK_04730 [Pikeienuella sp.]
MPEHHGKIHWSELSTPNTQAARDWAAAQFGWTYSEMPMAEGGTYYIASVGDTPVAGIMPPPPGAPEQPMWTTYVAVSDVDAVAKAAPSILQEPFDIPNVGRIAMIIDGGGAPLGIMTPAG